MEERIVELLNEEASSGDDTPFFMFLPLPHVHWPTGGTPFEFSDLYPNVEDWDRRNNLAMVSHFDAIIDTTVQTLKDNGQVGLCTLHRCVYKAKINLFTL